VLHHAFVVIDLTTIKVELASNATSLALAP